MDIRNNVILSYIYTEIKKNNLNHPVALPVSMPGVCTLNYYNMMLILISESLIPCTTRWDTQPWRKLEVGAPGKLSIRYWRSTKQETRTEV